MYFDASSLLRRTDFGFELLGPGPAMHCRKSTSLAIDIEDAYFT
ncbi:hypothetical protein ACFXKC_50830 [Streptomyces sp. NPDC059340]